MIITKQMLEERYGLIVMPLRTPIALIAGYPVVAQVVKYPNFEHLEDADWFKDILACKIDVPIFIMDLDKDLNPEGICLRVFVKALY